MKNNILAFILILCAISHAIHSQITSEYNTNQNSYENIDIIKTYGRVSDKGYVSIDMLKKLGNASFFNSNLVDAAKWYDKLFSLTTDFETVYYYRYAQSLKAVGNTLKAEKMMSIFIEKSKIN
ncbi:hypothetical protein [Flavobacterium frigoris]|uniref:Flagellar motor protein MotB n=1 Tax=Flavobacterium frigoris TaxID=229204 RepID=A0A1H9RF91_FLAFI|nr:hypothetical protein [Flavobacterium frigoris]SER71225.1 hypothetical protein SAMN05444355_12041 [Flavobacterium frigoris]